MIRSTAQISPTETPAAVAEHTVRISRPAVTLAMILCGVVSAAGMAAASAATPDEEVPAVLVRYAPQALGTEAGVHKLYRKIVAAAAQVCPDEAAYPFVSAAMQQCREQAIARAVLKINNPRLAAVHESASKSG